MLSFGTGTLYETHKHILRCAAFRRQRFDDHVLRSGAVADKSYLSHI